MRLLQFSGGIDSLATLWFLRHEWDTMHVLWCDTGAVYAETRDYVVGKIAPLVKNFSVAHGARPEWSSINGIAVEVVPERRTMIGALVHHPTPKQLYTSHLRCCAANLWLPMDQESRRLGATTIIRGQRDDDTDKPDVKSGHVDATGMRYEFPIHNWSRARVWEYCNDVCPDYIPEYYHRGETSSHDCWDCTAYLRNNVARIKNLPPDQRTVVFERLAAYNAAIVQDLSPLKELLNACTNC